MIAENIFIWAPSQRCGTGLLQRLLSSSKEVLVFGEDKLLAEQLPQLMVDHAEYDDDINESISRLASGDHKGWFPSALPFYEDYLEALTGSFHLLTQAYSKTAQSLGYKFWGSKMPSLSTAQLTAIYTLLPKSRHLFVYRNLFDVMRSIKARKWVEDAEAFRGYCHKWFNTLSEVGASFDEFDWFYTLSYDQLIQEPEVYTRKVQEFFGLGDLDLKVFDHKINTFTGNQSEGFSDSSYVKPESLNDYESNLCHQVQDEISKLNLFYFPETK
jgi:hypothetical protein